MSVCIAVTASLMFFAFAQDGLIEAIFRFPTVSSFKVCECEGSYKIHGRSVVPFRATVHLSGEMWGL